MKIFFPLEGTYASERQYNQEDDVAVFPNAKGASVYAPISGQIKILNTAKDEDDDGVLFETIGLVNGDISMRFGPIVIPRPIPEKLRAGDFIGYAPDALEWMVLKGARPMNPLKIPTTNDPTVAQASNRSGLFLAVTIGVGLWFLNRKSPESSE